jgi:threonine dehydratase
VRTLGDELGCCITLKIETLNPVRSFKGRGTETVLSWLSQRAESPTAVCASAGNLGQALAYSGSRRGIPVTVVAARTANRFKIERIRALGATVRLEGDDIEDARVIARTIAGDEGAHLVEDSLDVPTCEGAATIGLELLEGESQFDTLVIALGGGALASGMGYVARSLAPHVEVVAVQPEGAPAMALSWRCGSVVHTDTIDTIADGVAGRFPIPRCSTTSSSSSTTWCSSARTASRRACGCSTGTPGWSLNRRRRSGSRQFWRTGNALLVGEWPPSFAEATSRPTTTHAGC